MNNTFNSIRPYSNKITLTIAFIIYFLFSGVAFPYHAKQLHEITGKIVRILDVRWSYNQQDVMTLFGEMKEEGRAEYRFVASITDMIYPIVYGVLLILLIIFLTKNLTLEKWWLLLLLPILTMVFDFLENTTILSMLDSYPNISADTVNRSSVLSKIKWSFALMSVSTVLILGVINFMHRNRQKVLNSNDGNS